MFMRTMIKILINLNNPKGREKGGNNKANFDKFSGLLKTEIDTVNQSRKLLPDCLLCIKNNINASHVQN